MKKALGSLETGVKEIPTRVKQFLLSTCNFQCISTVQLSCIKPYEGYSNLK